MSHRLLVATYHDDLPQLQMCCHCLAKNWTGDRNLVVVWGKPNPKNQHLSKDVAWVEDMLSSIFDDTWAVEVIDAPISNLAGYFEQQANKVRFSIDPRFKDVIVFDSKDFLLKPTGIDFFKPDGRYRVAYFKNEKSLGEQYPTALEIVDAAPKGLPTPFNTTPWIWSSQQIEKFWNHMQMRFGDYKTWKAFPGSTEYIDFFIYNCWDRDSSMPMTDDEYEFVNFCGSWQGQSMEDLENQAREFDRWDSMRIWKHTRKESTAEKASITAAVLEKYGIDKIIVNRWRTEHVDYMPNIDCSYEI